MNKEQYRKNRQAGERGQGQHPDLLLMADITPASSARGMNRLRTVKHETALAKKNDMSKRRIGNFATARDISARSVALRQMRAA